MKNDLVNLKFKEKKLKNHTVYAVRGSNIQKWFKMQKDQTMKDQEILDCIGQLLTGKFLFDQTEPGNSKFVPKHHYSFFVKTPALTFISVFSSLNFLDCKGNYSGMESDPSFWSLNSDQEMEIEVEDPVEFSIELKNIVAHLQYTYVDRTGVLQFDRAKASFKYFEYITKVGQLQSISIKALSTEELKIFFINIYNCLFYHILLHTELLKGMPKRHLFNNFNYMISKNFLCLNDIRGRILRDGKYRETALNKSNSITDSQFDLSCGFDNRVHFFLDTIEELEFSCPVHVLTRENLDATLELNARCFLSKLVIVDENRKTVKLPMMLKEFHGDYGETEEEIVKEVVKLCPSLGKYFSETNPFKPTFSSEVSNLKILPKIDFSQTNIRATKRSSLTCLVVNSNSSRPNLERKITMEDIVDPIHNVLDHAVTVREGQPPMLHAGSAPVFVDVVGYGGRRESVVSALANDPQSAHLPLKEPKYSVPEGIQSMRLFKKESSVNNLCENYIKVEYGDKLFTVEVLEETKVWDVKCLLAEELSDDNAILPFDISLRKTKFSNAELFDEIEVLHPKNKVLKHSTIDCSLRTEARKLSKSPPCPSLCFAIGRGIRYAVNGLEAVFTIYFVDSNGNRCAAPPQKSLDIIIKRSNLFKGISTSEGNLKQKSFQSGLNMFRPSIVWDKESAICTFRLYTKVNERKQFSVTISIGNEGRKAYTGTSINIDSPELIRKAIWDGRFFPEVLQKLDFFTVEQIQQIGGKTLCKLVYSVYKSDSKNCKLSLISLFTRLLSNGKSTFSYYFMT